jgi:hypothetical protein
MLHSDLLAQQIAQGTKFGAKSYNPIGSSDANKLKTAQASDALGLAQASIASLFEGVQGAVNNRFTWATVKLYYSCFYAVRARLLLKGASIFYIGRSPHFLKSVAGCTVERRSGNSHSVVIEEFARSMAGDVTLSQEISQQSPLEWLEEKRNIASYKIAPFPDPEVSVHFTRFSGASRKHVAAYLSDETLLYAFDPDHAVIAFPLLMIRKLSEDLQASGASKCVVRSHFRDILTSSKCYVPPFESVLLAYQFSKEK